MDPNCAPHTISPNPDFADVLSKIEFVKDQNIGTCCTTRRQPHTCPEKTLCRI